MAVSWTPTAANFLGRVTKARILQAVAEGKGQRAADCIEHLKKVEMATEAETLLAWSGWLPEALRTPGRVNAPMAEVVEVEPGTVAELTVVETAADGGEPAVADDETAAEDDEAAEPAAAEEIADAAEISLTDEEGPREAVEVAFNPHAIAAE